jgi:hypothetical protein
VHDCSLLCLMIVSQCRRIAYVRMLMMRMMTDADEWCVPVSMAMNVRCAWLFSIVPVFLCLADDCEPMSKDHVCADVDDEDDGRCRRVVYVCVYGYECAM